MVGGDVKGAAVERLLFFTYNRPSSVRITIERRAGFVTSRVEALPLERLPGPVMGMMKYIRSIGCLVYRRRANKALLVMSYIRRERGATIAIYRKPLSMISVENQAPKLSATAKKGKKQITVKTDKGSTITLTANKKIFKGGKKKLTIKSAKASNKIKLTRKLKKGDKITVTATKSGCGTATVSKSIK